MSDRPGTLKFQMPAEDHEIRYAWFEPVNRHRVVAMSRLRPGQCFMRLPLTKGRRLCVAIVGHVKGSGATSPIEVVWDQVVGLWKRRDRRRS